MTDRDIIHLGGETMITRLRELLAARMFALPLTVIDRHHQPWTNGLALVDPNDADVAFTTRGYEDGPSWRNAHLIVAAVNALPALLAVAEAAKAVAANGIDDVDGVNLHEALSKLEAIPK